MFPANCKKYLAIYDAFLLYQLGLTTNTETAMLSSRDVAHIEISFGTQWVSLSEYSFATLFPRDDQSVENLIEGEVDDVVQPEDGRRGQDGSVDDVDGEDKKGEAEE